VYLEFYGLNEAPFDITPNPRYLYYSAKHREAFNHLLYGIRERKGFVQLTGEVGAGKTTLCRALMEKLDGHYSTALILNPVLDADGLMKAIAMEFGLNVTAMDRLEILATINMYLLSLVEQERDAVLIIDEAQDLTDDLLEQVRLLSNLETDDRKLLQIVLMGQTELKDRLAAEELRQLRQRILVHYELRPFTLEEMGRYIQHRLTVSGSMGRPYFTPWALRHLYKASRGIPRIINNLCDKALLSSFIRDSDEVNYWDTRRAARDLASLTA